MNGIEQALLQIRSLKEQRKMLKKQIQAREEIISNLLEIEFGGTKGENDRKLEITKQ
jgi:hypothetical protein